MKKYKIAAILANTSEKSKNMEALRTAMQIGRSRFYAIIGANWGDTVFATPIQLTRAAKHLNLSIKELINENPNPETTDEPLTLHYHEGITLFNHMVGGKILLQSTQSHGNTNTATAAAG